MPGPSAIGRNRIETAARVRTVFLFLAIFMILGWLLVNLKFIFLPLFLALCATFLLGPPVEWLRGRGVPRPLGLSLILAVVVGLLWLSSRYVVRSLIAFGEGWPRYEDSLALLISQAKSLTEVFPFLTVDRLRSLLGSLSLGDLAGGTLNSFITILGYGLMTLLFLLTLLPAYPHLPDKIRRAFPDRRGPLLCRALESIGLQVHDYIRAKTLTSLLAGVGVTMICLFFRVDFAVTWGVFAAALNFIPNLGSVLSVVPPAVICLLQPELGLSMAVGLTVVLTILMTLIGSVLEPIVLGQSVNLSPIASLLALLLWGWLWGTVGLIIAVPAMAMVKFTCDSIDSLRPIGVLLSAKN